MGKMKQFEKFHEYSDEELIIVVYIESEHWQPEAVAYADFLLKQRGISNEYALSRVEDIIKQSEILRQKELNARAVEGYNVFELIYMAVFWPRYIFRDWFLKRDGYVRKRKQRIYALGAGIMLFVVVFIESRLFMDQINQEKTEEIKRLEKSDSLAKLNINWSGLYVFLDTSVGQGPKIIWELEIRKERLEHSAVLKLIKDATPLVINCYGVIKNNDIEFYPDTTYLLLDGDKISRYDRLFTLVKEKDEIDCYWDKIRPYHYPDYLYNGIFRKCYERE